MKEHEILEERIGFDAEGLRLEGVLAFPDTGAPDTAFLVLAPHPHMGGTMDNNVVRHLARRGAAAGALTLRFNYRGTGASEIQLPPGKSVFDHFSEMEAQQRYEELLPDAIGAFRALRGGLAQASLRDVPVPDLPPQAGGTGTSEYSRRACPRLTRTVVVGYSLGAVIAGMLATEVSPTAVIAISPPVLRVPLTAYRKCAAPKCFVAGDDDFAFAWEVFLREYEQLPQPKTYRRLEGCDHFFRREEDRVFQAIADCIFGV